MAPEASLSVLRSVAELRRLVDGWHGQGLRVALVPTMGALHAGHLSLVRRGLQAADRVVASVFVNPTQFGPREDFAAYPRQEQADARLLAEAGAHGLYLPELSEMYPEGFATTISLAGPAEGLCGAFRPGHFSGVATVVAKLLLQARADIACFGEKDYQQLQVVRRLVRDLDIPVEIVGVPTVREPDGLAMSSRNAYLSGPQRAIAPALQRTLASMAGRLARGASVAEQLAWGRSALAEAGFSQVDYLELRDSASLAPLSELDRPARLLAAAWLGKTRLIDNVAVDPIR